MPDKPELLPCPFCGGESEIIKDVQLNYFVGECTKCNATGEPRLTEEYATISWNTRSDRWIPMTERRPKDGQIVVIFKPDAPENDDEYEVVEWNIRFNDLNIGRHLWHPLPALPTEVEG